MLYQFDGCSIFLYIYIVEDSNCHNDVNGSDPFPFVMVFFLVWYTPNPLPPTPFDKNYCHKFSKIFLLHLGRQDDPCPQLPLIKTIVKIFKSILLHLGKQGAILASAGFPSIWFSIFHPIFHSSICPPISICVIPGIHVHF